MKNDAQAVMFGEENLTKIIIQGIASMGAVAAAMAGYRIQKRRMGTKNNEKIMEQDITKKDFRKLVAWWQKYMALEAKLQEHADTTEIDRFLMLEAHNGKGNPTHVTATLQWHFGASRKFDYEEIPVDPDYSGRLNRIEALGSELVITSNLPDCTIKRYYENEGVTQSIWIFLGAIKQTNGSRRVFFCSMATHDAGGISPHTATKSTLLAHSIGKLAMDVAGGEHE